jgi:hypothetical protein
MIRIEIGHNRCPQDNKYNCYTVLVSDQGMGIPEEDKQKLFKPYFKSSNKESNEKNSSSHGLGLNICKRIAGKLGGDLMHNEQFTEGCQFIFTFRVEIALVESKSETTNSKGMKPRVRDSTKKLDTLSPSQRSSFSIKAPGMSNPALSEEDLEPADEIGHLNSSSKSSNSISRSVVASPVSKVNRD